MRRQLGSPYKLLVTLWTLQIFFIVVRFHMLTQRIFGLKVLGASVTNQTWSIGVVQNNVPLQCAFWLVFFCTKCTNQIWKF